MSVPTRPSSRPSTTMARALMIEPCASAIDETRPTTISEKYSAATKRRASPDSGGAKIATERVDTDTAKNEPTDERKSEAGRRRCRERGVQARRCGGEG